MGKCLLLEVKHDLFRPVMTMSFHPPGDSPKFGADRNGLVESEGGKNRR